MTTPFRYALVGTGSRAFMFRDALAGPHAAQGRLVALCDINPLRAAAWQADLPKKLPVYAPGDFARMIREERIDRVIVTSMDRTHHHYICAAMEAGCDVISEKPMTIDADRCAQILRTMAATGRDLRVTFNYRYAPRNSKVRELLAAGAIGDVLSVHFEWMLDTRHGADYFRRWHRDKRNSGGLLVHKATHHFDLVNWWLGTVPETVFAMGGLRFYGRENAESRGQTVFYERARDLADPASDPFAIDLRSEPRLKALYLDAEPADGYVRDRNVFTDGISIEDDMGVLVSYRNRAVMTYHLTAYSPWEGYRVSFNGTKGRLEYEVVEKAYTSGSEKDHNLVRNLKIGAGEGGEAAVSEPVTLLLRPHREPPVRIHIPETGEGGHGGGDARMLRDVFEPGAEPDPLGRAAGVRDGLYSVLCGAAGNRSLATGLPVRLADLVPGLPE